MSEMLNDVIVGTAFDASGSMCANEKRHRGHDCGFGNRRRQPRHTVWLQGIVVRMRSSNVSKQTGQVSVIYYHASVKKNGSVLLFQFTNLFDQSIGHLFR